MSVFTFFLPEVYFILTVKKDSPWRESLNNNEMFCRSRCTRVAGSVEIKPLKLIHLHVCVQKQVWNALKKSSELAMKKSDPRI